VHTHSKSRILTRTNERRHARSHERTHRPSRSRTLARSVAYINARKHIRVLSLTHSCLSRSPSRVLHSRGLALHPHLASRVLPACDLPPASSARVLPSRSLTLAFSLSRSRPTSSFLRRGGRDASPALPPPPARREPVSHPAPHTPQSAPLSVYARRSSRSQLLCYARWAVSPRWEEDPLGKMYSISSTSLASPNGHHGTFKAVSQRAKTSPNMTRPMSSASFEPSSRRQVDEGYDGGAANGFGFKLGTVSRDAVLV